MHLTLENLFQIFESTLQTPAEARAMDKVEKITCQKLTEKELDELFDAAVEMARIQQMDSFTLGFRLGVQLTLEGLKPVE